MPTTQLYTRLDSGIMTILPKEAFEDAVSRELTAVPQVVYLDFDGAVTSYHNRDLDINIDNVKVEDSGLTKERIAAIVESLNEQFAAQNVVFLTERPSDAEFSTIYVGKTDSFSEYGDFAGLAETVDVGNIVKNDNAFVMLDSTADDSAIIETIAHETEHLVGTLEHRGNGLGRYAKDGYIYYYYENNQIWNGDGDVTLIRYDSQRSYIGSSYQSSGGNDYVCVGSQYVLANNARVLHEMRVSSGGTANSTFMSGLAMDVYNCGIINYTSLYKGNIYIYSGGTANDTKILRTQGHMIVSQGGIANYTTLLGGGDDCVQRRNRLKYLGGWRVCAY